MITECKIVSTFIGKALYLTDGNAEIKVSLDAGPRIIHLAKKGGENIFFEDKEDLINKDVSAVYGEGKIWHIFGGHRIWASPESDMTYYPDNRSVSYRMTENGAVFNGPIMEKSLLEPRLGVEFTKEGIVIKNEIKNASPKTIRFAVWALTVCRPGGELILDLDTSDTGYLANRNIVYWHYTDINDNRLKLYNDRIVVKSNVSDTRALKIGTYNKKVNAVYKIGGTVFTKTVRDFKDGVFPDYNCNIETYTNNLIHEIETLSPFAEVKSGESLVHTEVWKIE